jgi:hypothetical protein
MLGLWASKTFSQELPSEEHAVGKRAVARWSGGLREKFLSSVQKIGVSPADSPLWVMLQLKVGMVPAFVDTGAQFSCVRADVAEFLYLTGEPCDFSSCSVVCVLADGKRCEVTNAVKLHVKFLDFSWDHELKILNGGSFPVIWGLDFLRRTTIVVNVACKSFSFGFALHCRGEFGDWGEGSDNEPYFQNLITEACVAAAGQSGGTRRPSVESLSAEFPAIFSPKLGTANFTPYEIQVLGPTPVRSPPYRCDPPKMVILREMVSQMLEE